MIEPSAFLTPTTLPRASTTVTPSGCRWPTGLPPTFTVPFSVTLDSVATTSSTGTPDSGVATTAPSALRTPTTLPSLSATVLPSGCSVPIVCPSGPVTTSPSTVDCGTTSVPGTGPLVAAEGAAEGAADGAAEGAADGAAAAASGDMI